MTYLNFMNDITNHTPKHDPQQDANTLVNHIGELAGRIVAYARIQKNGFDPTYERASVTRKLGDILTTIARITHAGTQDEPWMTETMTALEERGSIIWTNNTPNNTNDVHEIHLLLACSVTELVLRLMEQPNDDDHTIRLAAFRTVTLLGAATRSLRVPLQDIAQNALRVAQTQHPTPKPTSDALHHHTRDARKT